jgi:hypothetical protein
MTLEPVTEEMLAALVLPFLQKGVRHRVVMDREEEIGMETVCPTGPLEQAAARRFGGDQQDRPGPRQSQSRLPRCSGPRRTND